MEFKDPESFKNNNNKRENKFISKNDPSHKKNTTKNRSANPIQITAEQILKEASANQEEPFKQPKQTIMDPEEYEAYKMTKRKGFEDMIRMHRGYVVHWLSYAKWEEKQKEIERARSVYERALDDDYKNPIVYIKYSEMEIRHKNINHARNIYDKAVTLLPRMDQLWYKYIFMEEALGNYQLVRNIYERWMEWKPDETSWLAYIKFEMKYNEIDRARQIHRRLVQIHSNVKNWMDWAKFEEKVGNIENARKVYEGSIEHLGEEANDEKFFTEFANFEESAKEYERARFIYKYALDNLPKHQAKKMYQNFISFEKKYGDKKSIEEVISGKRRIQYEEDLRENPNNYDIWFDYIKLEESYGTLEKVRDVYERAISQIPPINEKPYWRRYIYLWINYAVFEELLAEDFERSRNVYSECLKIIPHKQFSFSKIWILFAYFELRQKNIDSVRKIFGQSLGISPKPKLFKSYIDVERKLGNIERARQLFVRFLEVFPSNCDAWCEFATFEINLSEFDRARGIYELSVTQDELDMPELVWKSYIDFEISQNNEEKVRILYEKLLERTHHPKVFHSYAQYESSLGNHDSARNVYEQAYKELKNSEVKEEREMLVNFWVDWEKTLDKNTSKLSVVLKLLPDKIKKRRKLYTEEGLEVGWEEYYEYVFPDEKAVKPNMKILEMAHKWKKQKSEPNNEQK